MLKSLSALLDKNLEKIKVEEVLSGAILIEEINKPVQSFFNIPLAIANKVVGILTVADIKSGLYQEDEMIILYKITQQASQAVTKLKEVVVIEQNKLSSTMGSIQEGVGSTFYFTIPAERIAVEKVIAK